ncbi:stage II sporulation protein M [Mangrovibacterium marinum]|uniref:Putative membrane protein SpoIIM required for sporulation n=1 Tax=Mangrovibacterium marinum TaxID=1639118 RepID=A0A2T5BZ96_9BACT|nr:stage II sporulation protein M [Mangrovibacterium marinum]PTN07594.1 putative membrane protein SpoIIM required for sporulation [Mangrovibacterium marinum]
MKEIVFIKRNSARWKKIEGLLSDNTTIPPDELYELYIGLNDDLSYANTFYPNSGAVQFLNKLTIDLHQKIYQNQKIQKGRFKRFWTTEYPLLIWENRKYIWYALAIFIVSALIGALSTAIDHDFPRLILGDRYVNMTLDHIHQGDPMAVYKKANEVNMFLGITINNIRVALYAFVAGVLLSVGSGLVLLKNGIMLGCFQYFFYQQGVLGESLLTIYIHGTLELFSIVIAGAAGMRVGNAILFPGTYSRLVSFQRGATAGLKIVAGVTPLFVVAGFLEGFITRHTNFPAATRIAITILSAAFIIGYFFLYPKYLSQQTKTHANQL